MPFNLMEPKLAIYRVIMVAGVVGFFLSFKINYFPTGFVCIASAVFTAVYLWEELMCSDPPKEVGRYDEDHHTSWFSFPEMLMFLGIKGLFSKSPLAKLTLYLMLPFIVWHVTAFGLGFGLHKLTSKPVTREFTVSPVYESRLSYRSYKKSNKAMKVKNMKTYMIHDVPTPTAEFLRIKNKKDVSVEIDSNESIFGLSFPTDFQFKTIKK